MTVMRIKLKTQTLIVIVTVLIVVSIIAGGAYYYTTLPTPTSTPTPTPPGWHLMVRRVFLWEEGESKFVGGPDSDLCDYLLQTLHRLNIQARCVFSEERVKEIKENEKVIELSFRFYEDVTISQWIEPEERDHIKTNETGYRILEKVKSALFILENSLDEDLEAYILIGSLTDDNWSCWAIKEDGNNKLDKSWVEEIGRYLQTNH